MLLGAELWEPGTPTDINRWQQQILQGVFPSLYILLLRGKMGGVHLLSPQLTQLCLSVPSDKAENGEPYQRRRGVGTPLPDSPPVFPTAKDAALTASSSSWRRILLMILAITIHNIPGKAQLSAWPSIYLSIPLSVHPCTLPGVMLMLSWTQPRRIFWGCLLFSLPPYHCCLQMAPAKWDLSHCTALFAWG